MIDEWTIDEWTIVKINCELSIVNRLIVNRQIVNKTVFSSLYPTLYRRWTAVVYPALIIAFILSTLQPFGLSLLGPEKWGIIFWQSLATAVISYLFTYLLPRCFPAWYDEARWTLGRFLIHLMGLILTIAASVWMVICYYAGAWLGWLSFVQALGWVLVLSLFPVTFFALWNRNLQLQRNLHEAMQMQQALSQRTEERTTEPQAVSDTDEAPLLCFEGDTREGLEVAPAHWLYAESYGNYVKMYYRPTADGDLQQAVLRLTMKQVEERLAGHRQLMRCHRAFAVNLAQVSGVSGNSQGYRLALRGCEVEIPVSRAYAKELKQRLAEACQSSQKA